MVDSTGAYNGYFVCEGAYGGNSVMRQLSPDMETFWQKVSTDDGLATGRIKKLLGTGVRVPLSAEAELAFEEHEQSLRLALGDKAKFKRICLSVDLYLQSKKAGRPQ